MGREYRDMLERVHMTQAGKRELAARLAQEVENTAPRPKRALRASLVAAVICSFLLVAVGAIAVNIPILRQFLGGGVVYDQNVQSLNLSQTVNGYTITITDCVGDDQFLYLGIELTAPEGVALDTQMRIGDETTKYSGFERGIGSGGGLRQLEDDDPTDNKMRFVWFRWVEKPLSGRDMTITFHNLLRLVRTGDGEVGKYEPVVAVEGDWSFGPFKLNFSDRAVELTPNVRVPLLDGETTVTEVKITPLHVEVMLEGGDLAAIHSTGAEKNGCYGLCTEETTLAIYGKDATQWDLPKPGHSGTWINTEGDRTVVMFSYHQLLNLDDLGSIEVCGVKIPIE